MNIINGMIFRSEDGISFTVVSVWWCMGKPTSVDLQQMLTGKVFKVKWEYMQERLRQGKIVWVS